MWAFFEIIVVLLLPEKLFLTYHPYGVAISDLMNKRLPILLFFTLLILLMMFSGCSDGDSYAPEPKDSIPDDSVPKDSVAQPEDTLIVPPDTVFAENDDISMDFRLINGRLDTVSSFVEGEDFIFLLNITNKSDSTLQLHKDLCFNGQDMFRVSSLDGEDWGTSWEYYRIPPNARRVDSHSSLCILNGWLGYTMRDYLPPSCKRKETPVLPAGHYRAVASLLLPDSLSTLTCAVYFEVLPFDTIKRSDCYQVVVGKIGDYGQVWASIIEVPENQASQTTSSSTNIPGLRKYEAPSAGHYIRFPDSEVPNRELVAGDSLTLYITGYELSYLSDHGRLLTAPHYDCDVILYK